MNVDFRLRKIVLDVLDDPDTEFSEELSVANCAAWDSVAMVQMVLAIEQEFGLRFKTDEVAELRSVSDLQSLLQKYGASQPPTA